jgi:putative CocE/NonD family hydrolase
VIVDRGVPMRMRDGVALVADIYRPDRGAPSPALVLRTPYDRSIPLIAYSGIDPERAVEAGYALVCQDVRGLYDSEGDFYTFTQEGLDGFDTLQLVAAQPWCDGTVGMVGRSYSATCEWLAAAERPPALKAISSVLTGSDFFRGWVYRGGAFELGFNLFWNWMMTSKRSRRAANPEDLFTHRPLRTVPLPDPEWSRFYYDWLDHPTDDAFWAAHSINKRYPNVDVPVLNVGGWFDVFLSGTLENFVRMRREGGSTQARNGQRLLVGPWAHGSTYGLFPDHSFDLYGPDDAIDFTERQLRFFDAHLRGRADGEDGEAPVRIFVMGANRWRDEDDWPLARARTTPWYLRTGGGLAQEPPGDEVPDAYVFDPRDPAPTIGGATSLPARRLKSNAGPLDQRALEERADVLVYTTEPLERPTEITGPLTAVLHVATDAADTDFVVKLTEVWPDGRSILLAEGVLRCRYRNGFERQDPVEPGAVYALNVDLVATSNVFAAGNRIRVLVTSSSFPRFDPNPNTGNDPSADSDADLRPARQTIFHDRARASHVLLPVVPRE